MPSILAWSPLLAPLAFGLFALVPGAAADRAPARMATLARLAAFLALGIAVAADGLLAAHGPLVAAVGTKGRGLGVHYDAVAAVIFTLVAAVGAVVVLYSRNYLAGDPGQGRFIKTLCLTLAAVLLLAAAGNVLQFAAAWVATSLGLHRLLLFYAERPAAHLAARKKFIASRIGDACLVAAIVLIDRAYGSFAFADIFAAAPGGGAEAAGPIAVLLVTAALLKSAQFPLHGWILEVMETPTPVSALLHAGIINAGGFLVLRFAEVIALSPAALNVLIAVGGITALFGSVVMLTQTSIKVSLAYSTIAQMGFMMLQCGLGAFPAALLHIVAHSFYKAHAFLSSGSIIDLARASWSPSPSGRPHPARVIVAAVALVVLAAAAGEIFGASLRQQPGVFALGAIVLLGLTHLVVNALDERFNGYVLGRTLATAGAVAIAYFALQWLAREITAGALPPVQAARGPLDLAVVAAIVAAFAVVTVLQSLLPGRADSPRWQALYAHVANGLYVNTLANRLVLRFWPSPAPTRAPSRTTP
jgi:NAD(P)H-quinone oxidoreductase subunit 5